MRRSLATGLAALLLAPALPAQSLARRLDRLLDAPPFDRHHWGVVVLDTTGKVLYGRNPTRLFIPASNTKLVVSAARSEERRVGKEGRSRWSQCALKKKKKHKEIT